MDSTDSSQSQMSASQEALKQAAELEMRTTLHYKDGIPDRKKMETNLKTSEKALVKKLPPSVGQRSASVSVEVVGKRARTRRASETHRPTGDFYRSAKMIRSTVDTPMPRQRSVSTSDDSDAMPKRRTATPAPKSMRRASRPADSRISNVAGEAASLDDSVVPTMPVQSDESLAEFDTSGMSMRRASTPAASTKAIQPMRRGSTPSDTEIGMMRTAESDTSRESMQLAEMPTEPGSPAPVMPALGDSTLADPEIAEMEAQSDDYWAEFNQRAATPAEPSSPAPVMPILGDSTLADPDIFEMPMQRFATPAPSNASRRPMRRASTPAASATTMPQRRASTSTDFKLRTMPPGELETSKMSMQGSGMPGEPDTSAPVMPTLRDSMLADSEVSEMAMRTGGAPTPFDTSRMSMQRAGLPVEPGSPAPVMPSLGDSTLADPEIDEMAAPSDDNWAEFNQRAARSAEPGSPAPVMPALGDSTLDDSQIFDMPTQKRGTPGPFDTSRLPMQRGSTPAAADKPMPKRRASTLTGSEVRTMPPGDLDTSRMSMHRTGLPPIPGSPAPAMPALGDSTLTDSQMLEMPMQTAGADVNTSKIPMQSGSIQAESEIPDMSQYFDTTTTSETPILMEPIRRPTSAYGPIGPAPHDSEMALLKPLERTQEYFDLLRHRRHALTGQIGADMGSMREYEGQPFDTQSRSSRISSSDVFIPPSPFSKSDDRFHDLRNMAEQRHKRRHRDRSRKRKRRRQTRLPSSDRFQEAGPMLGYVNGRRVIVHRSPYRMLSSGSFDYVSEDRDTSMERSEGRFKKLSLCDKISSILSHLIKYALLIAILLCLYHCCIHRPLPTLPWLSCNVKYHAQLTRCVEYEGSAFPSDYKKWLLGYKAWYTGVRETEEQCVTADGRIKRFIQYIPSKIKETADSTAHHFRKTVHSGVEISGKARQAVGDIYQKSKEGYQNSLKAKKEVKETIIEKISEKPVVIEEKTEEIITEKPKPFFRQIGEKLQELLYKFLDFLWLILRKIKEIFIKIFDFLKALIELIFKIILYPFQVVKKLLASQPAIWKSVKEKAVSTNRTFMDSVRDFLGKIRDFIKAALLAFYTPLVNSVKLVINGIFSIFKALLQLIKSVWNAFWNTLAYLFNLLVSVIKAIWNFIISAPYYILEYICRIICTPFLATMSNTTTTSTTSASPNPKSATRSYFTGTASATSDAERSNDNTSFWQNYLPSWLVQQHQNKTDDDELKNGSTQTGPSTDNSSIWKSYLPSWPTTQEHTNITEAQPTNSKKTGQDENDKHESAGEETETEKSDKGWGIF